MKKKFVQAVQFLFCVLCAVTFAEECPPLEVDSTALETAVQIQCGFEGERLCQECPLAIAAFIADKYPQEAEALAQLEDPAACLLPLLPALQAAVPNLMGLLACNTAEVVDILFSAADSSDDWVSAPATFVGEPGALVEEYMVRVMRGDKLGGPGGAETELWCADAVENAEALFPDLQPKYGEGALTMEGRDGVAELHSDVQLFYSFANHTLLNTTLKEDAEYTRLCFPAISAACSLCTTAPVGSALLCANRSVEICCCQTSDEYSDGPPYVFSVFNSLSRERCETYVDVIRWDVDCPVGQREPGCANTGAICIKRILATLDPVQPCVQGEPLSDGARKNFSNPF